MNISRENAGNLNAYVKIELQAEDYQASLEKELKSYQKKAQLKGFRPGMVPMSLVKKMYGKAILAEEVNRLMSDKLQEYIKEEKLDILGRPIAARDKETVADFDNPSNFVFWFELGLAPDFTLPMDKIKVDRYKITIDDKMVDSYESDLRRRYGNVTNPENAAEEDLLGGELEQLNENGENKEGGIKTKTSIAINVIALKTIQKKFIGKSIGDVIEFPIQKAFKNITDLASMLHISKEEAEKLEGDFRFTIESITHIEEAELNEDFFKQVYPSAEIKDEAGFKEEIRKEASKYYVKDTDRKFMNDVIDALVEKTEMELPEDFLKRWILEEDQNGSLSQSDVEKEFPSYAKSIKWQLIESKLFKDNNIEINPEDLRDFYRTNILSQYFPTGTQDEETKKRIDLVIDNMMQNQDEVKRVYDAMAEEKLNELFISTIKFGEKEILFDDFVAMLKNNK